MPSDIFNFIQTQIQTQTQAQVKGSSQNNNNSGSQPGLFDSLMTEYANINLDSEQQLNLELADTMQVIMSSANNSVPQSQSVIDILAGINRNSEGAEVFIPERDFMNPQEGINATQAFIASENDLANPGGLVSRILNDKNTASKIAALPEDKLQELSKILETLQNSESDSEIKSGLEKLFALLNDSHEDNNLPVINIPDDNADSDSDSGNIDFPRDTAPNSRPSQEIIDVPEDLDSDSDSDSESESNTPEVQDSSQQVNQFAGFVQVQGDNTAPEAGTGTKNDNAVNRDAPKHRVMRNDNNETVRTPEGSNESDSASKIDAKFNNVLNENESQENQESSQDSNNNESRQNNNQDSQSREDFAASRNSSRSRTESRRLNNTQTQNQNQTEPHSSFQSFFEGVLTARRTSSTPQPLNLRAAYNFNQSESLREGIVNVVRFIRADGVQKANMIIDPPAIGRISVELTSSTSGVEASIKVASEQVRQLVQDQLTQLRMNLSQQGVQVAEFTVDVQQDNQRQNQNNNNNQDNYNQGRAGAVRGITADDEPEELCLVRVDLQEGLLYWVA